LFGDSAVRLSKSLFLASVAWLFPVRS
jgi:hypothetical protein